MLRLSGANTAKTSFGFPKCILTHSTQIWSCPTTCIRHAKTGKRLPSSNLLHVLRNLRCKVACGQRFGSAFNRKEEYKTSSLILSCPLFESMGSFRFWTESRGKTGAQQKKVSKEGYQHSAHTRLCLPENSLDWLLLEWTACIHSFTDILKVANLFCTGYSLYFILISCVYYIKFILFKMVTLIYTITIIITQLM